MLKSCEDEIKYRKRWRVIELLIALTLVALVIIFIYISILLSSDKNQPKNSAPFIPPSLIWVFLISSFAFFFLKLFRKGFTDIQNTRKELENLRLKTIFLQNAVDEEDKGERSKMLLEYIKADNKMFLSPGEPTSESYCEDVEGIATNPLQFIKKFLENIVSLRPNHQ